MIESCHEATQSGITNWKAQMIYPYDHKFVIYEDIKSALTGYGRMMFYRTFSKDRHGRPDPTVADCEDQNWIDKIKEGKFNQGMAEGY